MKVQGRLMQARFIEIHQVFCKTNVGYFSNRVVFYTLLATRPGFARVVEFFLLNLTFANSKFIRNVLPVAPGASKKNVSFITIN